MQDKKYKEKYEELKQEYDLLKSQHNQLSSRNRTLEKRVLQLIENLDEIFSLAKKIPCEIDKYLKNK
tara:strand:- start:20370 stop:20570 length:201 start_codon:yes stop_codon:yes gene_type:complete